MYVKYVWRSPRFAAILFLLWMVFCCFSLLAWGGSETASWYSVQSCIRESGQCIMANGRRFEDDKLTCASWDYPFGTMLRITNLNNNRSVVVEVTDRGPAKRLYRQGRTIDLSKKAFQSIASLKVGVVPIRKEVLSGETEK